MGDATSKLGITGVHAIIFTPEAERVRAFLRDVLELAYVDAHDGWLIFALPPAEVAVHPADDVNRHELFLMCDDIHATVAELERRGVAMTGPVSEESFGLLTAIAMPDGGRLQLYQPTHASPIRRAVEPG